MKDIEGIEKALAALQPYWQEIEAEFNRHNERFLKLLAVDHEPIGRILRAHLVIENFLDTFLTNFYEIEDFDDLRLTFAQKTKLLPSKRSSATFVRPGIIQLNAVRNKFGHDIDHSVDNLNLSAVYEVLRHTRPNVRFESHVRRSKVLQPWLAPFCQSHPGTYNDFSWNRLQTSVHLTPSRSGAGKGTQSCNALFALRRLCIRPSRNEHTVPQSSKGSSGDVG